MQYIYLCAALAFGVLLSRPAEAGCPTGITDPVVYACSPLDPASTSLSVHADCSASSGPKLQRFTVTDGTVIAAANAAMVDSRGVYIVYGVSGSLEVPMTAQVGTNQAQATAVVYHKDLSSTTPVFNADAISGVLQSDVFGPHTQTISDGYCTLITGFLPLGVSHYAADIRHSSQVTCGVVATTTAELDALDSPHICIEL